MVDLFNEHLLWLSLHFVIYMFVAPRSVNSDSQAAHDEARRKSHIAGAVIRRTTRASWQASLLNNGVRCLLEGSDITYMTV